MSTKRGACERKHILTGRRFGRLLVLGPDDLKKNGCWFVRCDCGVMKSVRSGSLVTGGRVSCGCYKDEVSRAVFAASKDKAVAGRTRHGKAVRGNESRAYRIWGAMLQRCTNPRAVGWRYYGAKGVTVCDRWRDFANFLADMGEPPAGRSIDRVNPFGNYEPGNCRWATRKEQDMNTRRKYLESIAKDAP